MTAKSYTVDAYFTLDSKELVTLSFLPNDEFFIAFWDTDTDKLVRRIDCPIMAGKLGILPKSQTLLASGGMGDAFAVFAGKNWEHRENLRIGKTGPSVHAFCALPDGKRVVLIPSGMGQSPIIWDIMTKEFATVSFPEHKGFLHTVALIPDGKKFAVAGSEKTLAICDVETAKLEKQVTSDLVSGSFYALDYSPDGKLLASECQNTKTKRSMVALWDTTTWKIIHHFDGYDEYPTRLRFTKDGKYLIAFTGVENVRGRNSIGYVYIWSVEDRKLVEQMTTGKPSGKKFVLSPDEKHLVTLSADGTVRKWDFAAIRKDFEAKLAKEKAKK